MKQATILNLLSHAIVGVVVFVAMALWHDKQVAAKDDWMKKAATTPWVAPTKFGKAEYKEFVHRLTNDKDQYSDLAEYVLWVAEQSHKVGYEYCKGGK